MAVRLPGRTSKSGSTFQMIGQASCPRDGIATGGQGRGPDGRHPQARLLSQFATSFRVPDYSEWRLGNLQKPCLLQVFDLSSSE